MNYWLMKSEPDVYSIADLEREQIEIWDGVRNYQARNFLRQMQVGDRAFFYHSNTQPPGIAGLMEIVQANLDDPSQFDRHSPYYDEQSTPENPRWQTVKVGYLKTFAHYIALNTLKATFSPEELLVVKRGNRLSVMPVSATAAEKILAIAEGASFK
ncbi:EVE domain-containing protein [Almyronema epifaneia]|uniref:EVE domain-containing protein n=1 Tax=Almyronema epifaneia S1 TaxID=2991925 RepID=A0ABW6IC42_9CYAN